MSFAGIDMSSLREFTCSRRVYDESGNYVGRATWDGTVSRVGAGAGFSIGGPLEYAEGNAVQFRRWRQRQSRKSKRALWRGQGITFAEFVRRFPLAPEVQP